eukprot:9865_1
MMRAIGILFLFSAICVVSASGIMKRIVFNDGSIYEGKVLHGNMHGQGKLMIENGDVYKGGFKENTYNGKGKLTYENGNFYDGHWENGEKNGIGKESWQNNVYFGGWKDGYKHGQGKYIWDNGNIYEGNYQNGERHGKGKFTWENGNVYVGEFVSNHINGFGKFTWLNNSMFHGDEYEGTWESDRENGSGTYRFSNGNVYIGDVVECFRTGYGKYTWLDNSARHGDEYEGQFKDNRREGTGTYRYSNGNVYVGEFVSNFRTGWGKYAWLDNSTRNGDEYEGQFKRGLQHGTGTYRYSDGDVYVGEWVNGNRTGNGKLTSSITDNVSPSYGQSVANYEEEEKPNENEIPFDQPRENSDNVPPSHGQSVANYEEEEKPNENEIPFDQPREKSDTNTQKTDERNTQIESDTDNYGNTSSDTRLEKPDNQEVSTASGTSLRGTLYALFVSACGTILTVIINILANGAVIQCILEAQCMQGCFGRHPWFKQFLKMIFVAAASVAVTQSLNNKNLLDQVAETASVAKGYFGDVWGVLSSVLGVLTVAGSVVGAIFRRVLCRCCYKKEKPAQMPEVPERSYVRHRHIDVKPDEHDYNARPHVDGRDRW